MTGILIYASLIGFILFVSWTLHLKCWFGKFRRALLISAAVGAVVPVIVYFTYPYFNPPQIISPTKAIDQIHLNLDGFYELSRIITAFIFSLLTMFAVSAISFVFQYSGPEDEVFPLTE